MMENKKYINEPDKQHLLPSLFFYVFALFSWQYVYSHRRWLPSRPGASRLVYLRQTAPMFQGQCGSPSVRLSGCLCTSALGALSFYFRQRAHCIGAALECDYLPYGKHVQPISAGLFSRGKRRFQLLLFLILQCQGLCPPT